MKVDIRKIETGDDEVIVRYKEETGRIRKILDVLRDGGEKLYGKKESDVVSVIPGDILYIESVDDKIFAYTCDDVIRLEGTLAGIIQKLGDERFFRCSKSMIINIDKVDSLHSLSSNRIDATMEGGEHIMISRTYASEFRRILRGYSSER
ncbi:MAG: LytTR family transcriptional regulator [Lachnospiraceae bacterium]|nr:LytTR family transcriptional regulator [Lachnospiraceae bacterium]